AFFTWAVRERLIVSSPVVGVRIPATAAPPERMRPWTWAELQGRVAVWRACDGPMADVALLLGLTGLRWSEARALRVGDVDLGGSPGLLVERSRPEGAREKTTTSGRARRVPLAGPLLPIVEPLVAGSHEGEPLLPPLHRTRFLQRLEWPMTGQGRRIHDLRHTAVCLWLSAGVDVATVRAWAGHADLATTSRYVHYLGTSADVTGLDRLDGYMTGT